MQELEKILEKMKEIKDGNRKEKLYAKYPPNGRDQETLNAYSQGYEDGTDNFYNAIVDDVRNHMNDGWIPVEEALPEDDSGKRYIITDKSGNVYAGLLYGYADDDDDKPCFHNWDDECWRCFKPDVAAWAEYPDPYRPERSDNHDGE